MQLLIDSIYLFGGIYILLKGAGWFLSSARVAATRLGISELIIGLTIVALGTSLPELAASLAAASKFSMGMVFGNVLGSNLANISLLLGVGAFMAPIAVSDSALRRDGLLLLLFTALIAPVLFVAGEVTVIAGLLFILLFFWYWMFLLYTAPDENRLGEEYSGPLTLLWAFLIFPLSILTRPKHIAGKIKAAFNNGGFTDLEDALEEDEGDTPPTGFRALWHGPLDAAGWPAVVIYFIIGIVMVVYGSKAATIGGLSIAHTFGISETVIGLTLIAVGTSLPELGVTIVAVRRGMGEMLLGNLLGSNISNILLIIGATSLVYPQPVNMDSALKVSAFICFGVTVLVAAMLLLARNHSRSGTLGKRSGSILVLYYIGFLIYTAVSQL